MTHTRAKVEGQRSLGSKVTVETDERTYGQTVALPPVLTRSLNILHISTCSLTRLARRQAHITCWTIQATSESRFIYV